MMLLAFIHPGNPSMFELFGILFAILIVLYALTMVYEFIKRKPWRKVKTEDVLHSDQSINHTSI